MLFIVATNPVGSSTLIRSAYRSGVKPYGVPVVDELEDLYKKEDEQ
jgi:multisubunit Na+/H+ antiporter MnhG subunit